MNKHEAWRRVVFMALVLAGAAISGADGGAMVSGTVFCDQCKDGRVSFFDYPLGGVNVAMLCPGSNAQMQVVGQETTNMFGGYTMRFDGTPDLSGCYAQVATGGSTCQASAGPAQSLALTFSFFGMEFYSANALLSQPAQPMSFCPGSRPPATPTPPTPPPVPVAGPAPPAKSPPFRLPPAPFLEPSACSHQYWMMPEYRCYWRVVNPDTKVGLIFGPLAALKYGRDATLWTGLQGRADPYKTLLREGIAALLNSYNTFQFPYTSLGVVQHLNMALMGSPRAALLAALRFKRANSGGNANAALSCKFKSCK